MPSGKVAEAAGKASSKIVSARAGENREDAENDSPFDFAVTGFFLYALIVELTMKGHWYFEKSGQDPEHKHQVEKLFKDLQDGTRAPFEAVYEDTCRSYKQALSEGLRQLGQEGIRIEMALLQKHCNETQGPWPI